MPRWIKLHARLAASQQIAQAYRRHRDAPLLFLMMLPHCDWYGILPGHAAVLKGLVCPLLDIDIEQVEAALEALEAEGLILRYSDASSRPLIWVRGWLQHQDVRWARVGPPQYDLPPEWEPPPELTDFVSQAANANKPLAQWYNRVFGRPELRTTPGVSGSTPGDSGSTPGHSGSIREYPGELRDTPRLDIDYKKPGTVPDTIDTYASGREPADEGLMNELALRVGDRLEHLFGSHPDWRPAKRMRWLRDIAWACQNEGLTIDEVEDALENQPPNIGEMDLPRAWLRRLLAGRQSKKQAGLDQLEEEWFGSEG